MMKFSAGILSLIWAMLMIEPAFANLESKQSISSCSSKAIHSSCCSKNKCSKPKQKESKDDCENNRCNPLMSCPAGNFYLFNPSQISFSPLEFSKQKIVLVNDNRISKHLTDCWHPPEII